MIRLGSADIANIPGIAKVMWGADQIWPAQVGSDDLVSITYNGTCITYDDTAIGYPWAIPAEYTELHYVTLKNKLIDTGEKTTNGTEIKAKIQVTSASSAATYLWYSDSGSSLTTNTTAYCSSSGNWRFGNRTFSIANATYIGAMHEFIQNSSGVWIDGTKINSYSTVSTFTSSANLRFGSSSANGEMRVAYFRHSIDGGLVSYYIPVKRVSDNVAGFWDVVKEEFTEGGTAGPVA